MVELSESPKKGGYTIERYAIELLPKDAITDATSIILMPVSECMQRAWKRMGTRIKNVSLALPSAAVITKKILLPAGLNDEELEYQVESEANQYIPFALEEVNLDFQVIGLRQAIRGVGGPVGGISQSKRRGSCCGCSVSRVENGGHGC